MNAAAGRVLVVDDNRVNQLLLGRSLEQQGHTVEFAENGRRALDLLGESRFDLMLLDVEMPEVDGYEVLAEMKDDPRLREVPVIMTSALDELDSVVRCIEMGAEDYLTKPVNPVLLQARVGSSLEKKRLHDQQRELISKFATREVADDLLTSGFSLGGKFVDAAAMFCDIRSFTTIAEAQGPAETIELLNDYYTLMMDAIGSQGGVVNQMVGDGLMAIFGAPGAGRGLPPARGAGRPADDRADRALQPRPGVPPAGPDLDRHRHRLGAGDRGLHGDAAPRDLHVRRRHGQPRRTARVAHEGARAVDPDRREHARRAGRRDRGPARGRVDAEGQDATPSTSTRSHDASHATPRRSRTRSTGSRSSPARRRTCRSSTRAVHAIVGELMYADNFFIALYDEERQLDQLALLRRRRSTTTFPTRTSGSLRQGDARGVTAYVLRTGKPQLMPHERLLKLVEQGEVELRRGR